MLRNRRGESQEAESSSSANRSISQKLQQQRAQDSDDSEDEVEDELLGRERRSIQSAFLRALSPPLPSGIDGSKRWNSLKQDAEKVEKGKGKGKEKEKNEEKERPIPENELQEQDHDGADLMCRICWCGDLEEDEGPEGQLIAPCGCSGTSKYIHKSCLKEWRQKGGGKHSRVCPQCDSRYKMNTSPRILLLIWATNNELLRMLMTVVIVSSLVLISGALGALIIIYLGSLIGYGSSRFSRSFSASGMDPRYNISIFPSLNHVQIELFREKDILIITSGVGTLSLEMMESYAGTFYHMDLQEEARANALRMVEVEMEMEPSWLQHCDHREEEEGEDHEELLDEEGEETDEISNLAEDKEEEKVGEAKHEEAVSSEAEPSVWEKKPHVNGSALFLPHQAHTPLPIFRSLEVFPPTSLHESLLLLNPSTHQTVYRMNSVESNDSFSFHDDLLKPMWLDWAGLNSSSTNSNPKASRNLKACRIPGVHRKAFTIEYVWKSKVIRVPRLFQNDDVAEMTPAEEHPLINIFPESHPMIRILPIGLWIVFVNTINSCLPEVMEATARSASQLFWLVASREAIEEIVWAIAQICLHGTAAFLIEYSAIPGLRFRNPTLHKLTKYGSHSAVFLLDQIFGSGRAGIGSIGGYPLTVYKNKNKNILPIDFLVFYSIFAPRFILPAQYLLGFLLWLMTFSSYLEEKVASSQESVKRMQNSDWNVMDNSAAVGFRRMLDGLAGGTGSQAQPYDLYQVFHKEAVAIPGKVRPYDLARVVERNSWIDFFYLSIYLGCLFVAIGSYWPALRWTYRHGLRHVIQEGRLHFWKLRSLLWTYFKTISRFGLNFWNRFFPTSRASNRRVEGEPVAAQPEEADHLPSLGTQLTDISSAFGWLYISSLYVFRALQQVTWWLCIVPHMTVSDWIENYLSSIVISQEVLDRSGR